MAAEFNWDDVKSDKHRENYLGHSVKAPVGRWQKGKDFNNCSGNSCSPYDFLADMLSAIDCEEGMQILP